MTLIGALFFPEERRNVSKLGAGEYVSECVYRNHVYDAIRHL